MTVTMYRDSTLPLLTPLLTRWYLVSGMKKPQAYDLGFCHGAMGN